MIRIVKMHFREEKVADFVSLYSSVEKLIASFPGCRKVTLLKDKKSGLIYFTISVWESEEALENYRKSILFNETWQKTKAMFAFKAEAWTTDEVTPITGNLVA